MYVSKYYSINYTDMFIYTDTTLINSTDTTLITYTYIIDWANCYV